MERFEIKGDNGFIKIELKEVFRFPNKVSNFGGYECRADIEIKIPNYQVKGNFCTSTREIYNFCEDLKRCQSSLNGAANYSTYEGHLDLKIKYNGSGQAEITGSFQQSMLIPNCLAFEINSDQSYLKYSLDEIEMVVKKYGDNKRVKIESESKP